MRTSIRRAAGRILARLRVADLRSALLGRRHLILTFHRVRPDGIAANPLDTCPSVSGRALEGILRHVRERFEVVSLLDLCGRLGDRRRLAAITFDDGWRDNRTVAFPILQALGLPAAVFVTTGRIGSSEPFWQQRLGACFRAAGESPRLARLLRDAGLLDAGLAPGPGPYRDSVRRLKALAEARRLELLDALLGAFPPPPEAEERLFLSEEEIREMASAGTDFGSHGATHAILGLEGLDRVRDELRRSRERLEAVLGAAPALLAYPDGSCPPAVVEAARHLGYRVGCTTRRGLVGPGTDPMRLPRVDADWDALVAATGRVDAAALRWAAR